MNFDGIKIQFSTGAVLFLALLLYYMPLDYAAAYLLSIMFHECGHLIMLRIFGLYPRMLLIQTGGFLIDYAGELSGINGILCAVAGSFFGILFSLLCSHVGNMFEWEFMYICSGVSLLLSVFNMLPAIPLDGAIVLKLLFQIWIPVNLTEKIVVLSSCIVTAAFLFVGIFMWKQGYGIGLIIMAVLMLLHLLSQEGIVKKLNMR